MTVARAGLASLALALAAPAPARASGFLLHEHSAEALARGGAVTAGTREPAAVWFNPAALAYAPGPAISVTGTYIRPRTRFRPEAGGAQVSSIPGNHVVPSLFAHAAVHDRVTVGLGVYAPFGLAMRWPDGWVGSQSSLRTRLYAAAANPVVAWRLRDRLAVAAGVSVYRGGVEYTRDLPTDVGGRAVLEGSAWGLGANASVLFRWRPDVLHLAASYHSRARLAFHGDVDFSAQNGTFFDIFVDQKVTAGATLPDVITLAVMVRPVPRLEVGAELTQVRWSTFERLYLDFERPGTPDIPIQRGTRNPLTGRVGVEGWLPRAAIALRGGAFLDQSASSPAHLAPFAPDAHRLGLSAGLGYALGRARIDLAYLYAHFFAARARPDGRAETPPPPGTYRTRLQVVALTVTLR